MLNKKGFEFIGNWIVIFFVAIIVLSLLLALVIVNQWVNYIIIIFGGAILGRFMFTSKHGNRFPYYLLSFAFISGYLIGHRAGNWLVMLVLFIVAIAATNKFSELS